MLKKFAMYLVLAAAPIALVGCADATNAIENAAETAKDGVDTAAEGAKDAAGNMVPESQKENVEGAVDKGADMAKEGVDATKEALGSGGK